MAREEKDSVEGLKSKLYSRNSGDVSPDIRSPLSPRDAKAPVGWGEAPLPPSTSPMRPSLEQMQRDAKPRMSWASKFFFGSIAFFVVAALVAAYIFFVGGNAISPQNIDVQI